MTFPLHDLPCDRWVCEVPTGQSGDWVIADEPISDDPGFPVTMRTLRHSGTMSMDDTPLRWRTHRNFVYGCSGDVLIAGLGLGVVIQAVLSKPGTTVTVLDLSADVVSLVEASLRLSLDIQERLTVIQADVWTWEPPEGAHWDYAWFDIWNHIDDTSLEEQNNLMALYADYATNRACWGHDELS